MNDEEQFFQLLKYSNKLEKSEKFLWKEEYEEYRILLKFLATIANNLQYLEKQEYIQLAKIFMSDQNTAYDFK